jgi:hypothetical protein
MRAVRCVGAEAELAEESVEEATTLVVVGSGELEKNTDVGLDAHCLKNGDRRASGNGCWS